MAVEAHEANRSRDSALSQLPWRPDFDSDQRSPRRTSSENSRCASKVLGLPHAGQPVGKRSEIIGGSVKLRANPLYFRGDTNSLHLTELGRISPLRFGHARKSSISAGYLIHRSNFFDGQSGQKLLPSSVKTGLKRSVSQR